MLVEESAFREVCTGCGCCANICPETAINMKFDEMGYLKPYIDETKCMGCGKCEDVCPAINKYETDNYTCPECFAVWAEDEIRMKSSSGGFFTVLSDYVFEKGGYVFGASWDEDFYCRMGEASRERDIVPMRLSKYVQCQTGYAYRDVEERLSQNKLTAYFGCPCQIAGLHAYLSARRVSESKKENLITVDLVCFCAPSNELFRKYIDEEYGIENVDTVKFRDKKSRGWSPVSYSISLKDGRIIYPDPQDDPYQRAFHGVMARNDICDNCKYYQFPRQGDFTIGDFWGLEQHKPEWIDQKGISVVLVNNNKSATLMQTLKGRFAGCESVPLQCCMNKGNRIGSEARPSHIRKGYFEELVTKHTFRYAVECAIEGAYEIGCVCMFNYNIGNNLTNYALYRTLRKMGYSVLMIGNPKVNGIIPFGCGEDRFRRFKTNPYHAWEIARLADCKEALYELNEKCERFVVGSDQLWRKGFLDEMDYYPSLDWVGNRKCKIAYATSFGIDEFEGNSDQAARLGFLLGRFFRISVREKSGVEIVKKLTGRNAESVMDPVFLCDTGVYEDMAGSVPFHPDGSPYVAAYFLDKTHEKEDALLKKSRKLTCGKYYAATDYPEIKLENGNVNYQTEISVEEWLAMVRGSEFFLTDSFHGVCFALIFHKDFAVLYDKDNWRGYVRIYELLDLLGLADRMIERPPYIDSIGNLGGIDWRAVDQKLNGERERSLQWIKRALNDSGHADAKYDLYDEMIRRESRLYKKQKNTEIQLRKDTRELKSDSFLTKQMLKKISGREMTVIGFGMGACFYRNLPAIKEVYELKMVCDNDPSKWGRETETGIVCISPEKLREVEVDLVVILVDDVRIAFEIAGQLLDMGITHFTHITNWLHALND